MSDASGFGSPGVSVESVTAGIGEDIEQHTAKGENLLTGPLVDQSRLHGILDHVRQLGVEVLRLVKIRLST